MNHIYIRPLNLNDEAEKAAFVAAVEGSGRFFPIALFALPTTRIMVAERREEHGMEVIGYMPQYISLVMGSWVAAGGATPREEASALHQLTAAAYTRCHENGLADILILSDTEETVRYALRHGYEEAHKCLRLEVR